MAMIEGFFIAITGMPFKMITDERDFWRKKKCCFKMFSDGAFYVNNWYGVLCS